VTISTCPESPFRELYCRSGNTHHNNPHARKQFLRSLPKAHLEVVTRDSNRQLATGLHDAIAGIERIFRGLMFEHPSWHEVTVSATSTAALSSSIRGGVVSTFKRSAVRGVRSQACHGGTATAHRQAGFRRMIRHQEAAKRRRNKNVRSVSFSNSSGVSPSPR